MCFFFSSRRRHTRFDCDWSSDVCSSDLGIGASGKSRRQGERRFEHPGALADGDRKIFHRSHVRSGGERSGERRGGEEWRTWWAPDHLKKKKKEHMGGAIINSR